MRAETVHVTDHALLRWKERASKTGEANVQEIVQAVKESKVIKKGEPLPYPLPRLDGSVYTFNAGLLFILESVTIDEYRLVTVISENPNYRGLRPPKKNKINRKAKYVESEKMEIDMPQFDSPSDERTWLTEEKRRLERLLAEAPKKSAKRKDLLKVLGGIESRLTDNKPRYIKERDQLHQEEQEKRKSQEGYVDYGATLLLVLRELKELRVMVEALYAQRQQQPGSPGNRSAVEPLHVQPSLSGVSDLAAEGDGPLQQPAEQDSAA